MMKVSRIHKLANSFISRGADYWGKAGAGLFLLCLEDETALLLQRSDSVEQPGTWGIAGGAIEHFEDDSLVAAKREAIEELGSIPELGNIIDTVVFKDGDFVYTSYVFNVSKAEKETWTKNIKLNWENTDARWFPLNALPANLHFGTKYIKEKMQEKGIDPFEDPKNKFDWIRTDLKYVAKLLSKPTLEAILLSIDNVPDLLRGGEDDQKQQQIDFFNNLNATLRAALKELITNKHLEAAVVMRDIMRKVKISGDHLKDWDKRLRPDRELKNLPKSQQAEHSGLLYHGTTLAEAASVLKSKSFSKGSAYDRLSLTSDITVAMKFGDVIFAFDAARLQRKGAKKMRYFDVENKKLLDNWKKQKGREFSVMEEDSREGAIINDIYRYEKEWYVWMPFKFDEADLSKMILVKSDQARQPDMNKAKDLLERITKRPVQLISYLSYAQHGIQYSEQNDLNAGDLKFHLFNTFALGDKFMAEGRKLIDREIARMRKDYPDWSEKDCKEVVVRKSIYYLVNGVYRELQQLQEKRRSNSIYDGSNVKERFENLKHILDNTKWGSWEYPEGTDVLKPILEAIIASHEPIHKGYVDTHLSTDEQFYNAMAQYPSSYMRPYRTNIMTWVASNLDKLEQYAQAFDSSSYEDMNRRKGGTVGAIVRDCPFLTQISDETLRKVPGEVIDNANFESLGAERIRRLFSNNPAVHDYNFKYDLQRSTGSRKAAIQIVSDIYYAEHPNEKPEPLEPSEPAPTEAET